MAQKSVLVVEDDADARQAITAALGAAGYAVLASDEGRKALELTEVARPAVILLDLMTEGMTGWEFLARRNASPTLARIPVIVMTAATERVPEADVVLRKPFELQALLAAVEHAVSRPTRR